MLSFIVVFVLMWLVVGGSYTLGAYDSSDPGYQKVIKDNVLKAIVLAPLAVFKSLFEIVAAVAR